MKITTSLLCLFCAVFSENAISAEKDIRAAFVYSSPIGDAGWTFAHEQGRKEMSKLPFVKESIYVDSVPEGEESVKVIQNLARQGYNMIVTTSFGYMDPTLQVAKIFPNTTFLHCSGYKISNNMGTYFGRIEQPRYLSGMIAGKMTKSNYIGIVAAFPIPEVIRGINAFALGAQSMNPKVQIRVVWSNTWFDPVAERAAAESLISIQCDVLAMHQDSPATLQVAEEAGKYCMGYNGDTPSFAPKGYLCAPIWNWGVYYTDAATKIHEGKWQSKSDWWGIEKGIVDLSPMTAAVPEEIRALVEAKRKDMIANKFQPFTGPVKDQEGNIVVPQGSVLSDSDELKMNYFVEGVKGTIAKVPN